MERVICLVIGYAFGLFQTGYFYGKTKGIDIRQYGSGNSGTTNTLRVLGPKAGLIVLLGDICKCILAIGIVKMIFAASHPHMVYLLCLYTGAGAILGHNYPFYMGFKGGKGIAATAGMVIAFHPWFLLVGLIIFFSTFFITHYVSLGSLLVYVGLMIEMVILGENGFFKDMSRANLLEMYILFALLAALAFWKHRTNIARLIHGEERKTYLTKKNKAD